MTSDLSGCPPLRAFTTDTLGLVKVIEARSKEGGVAKLVQRWGDPDASKGILATAISSNTEDTLLGVARKNGLIEFLSPVDGELRFSISNDDIDPPEDDPVSALHMFKKDKLDPSRSFLTCTKKGRIRLKTLSFKDGSHFNVNTADWTICSSGEICCFRVHDDEKNCVLGGKGNELTMWDLGTSVKTWTSKAPRKDSLGIFTPTWFTSVTFLNKDDHRKVVAGTKDHEVRLYDISSQRRPVLAFNFKEAPINAIAEDLDGITIHCGNGSGDLASIDIRTGKVLGHFTGKCSGSIKSIARHPEHSVIASCGLDSYLRFWDVNSRELLSAVYLKQHLTSVVFDSNFSDEETTLITADQEQEQVQDSNKDELETTDVVVPAKRKKNSKDSNGIKKKSKKKSMSS